MEVNNLISSTIVSSVLNRDVKQFGKKFLFDNNDDTCWNSDQGEYQHVTVQFEKPVCVTDIHVQFQGGFSCKQFDVKLFRDGNEETLCSCYPEDVNVMQQFKLESVDESSKIKLLFTKHTDFFGRIIIYNLKFYGKVT
ncbi:nuclear receptor 2C2-associated protein-like [Hydractinia symbiolongicarpus]|uniref:nuclear receptor 2C2-associated protein-like n=1 Tax=Hydractinia symbiolongicarpus TaxID=13093 RepID=UPI00254CD9A5|nr:nuclear receptor 2C2-associated protein-like [Hydractinia symbiolongicarpus]XP_057294798.1 nuclear receptor 2C2-associated protein-like [Hydractinia symbiolongicarpus]